MHISGFPRAVVVSALVLILGACATAPTPYDYSAFKQSRPKSLVVLPALNHSPDINAGASVMSRVSYPLAEAGYYVLPVTLVTETFRQNGLDSPEDIQALAPEKLREIFGADAALYMEIQSYGTTYQVVNSDTVVAASARLVDLRDGQLLWQGSAKASSAESRANQAGLVGILVQAVVEQIADTVTDQGHVIAGVTSQRLLAPRSPDGMLYGPRSPNYRQD